MSDDVLAYGVDLSSMPGVEVRINGVTVTPGVKPMQHSQHEIVERFKARREADMFGWEIGEYVRALDFEHVKPLLDPKAQEDPKARDEWKADLTTRDQILGTMQSYMAFAFEKANGQRGLSANRSIMHYIAWIWLAGDDAFAAEIDAQYDKNYCEYGKPILVRICEHYGWDWKAWDV